MSYFPEMKNYGSLQNLWLYVTSKTRSSSAVEYDHVVIIRHTGLDQYVRDGFTVTFYDDYGQYVSGRTILPTQDDHSQILKLYREVERSLTSYSCVHNEVASITFLRGGTVDVLYRQSESVYQWL